MIRRRSVYALVILFGAVILVLAYGGIESSRKNMLKLLQQEGASIMQALMTSARNNLAASTIFEEAATDRLVDISSLLGDLLNQGDRSIDSLASWQRRFQLERIDLVVDSNKIVASSDIKIVGTPVTGDSDLISVLDSVATDNRRMAVAPPMPSALPQDDYTFLALRTRHGVMLITAKARKLTDYQQSLGIGFVVRQLGGQPGIDYVVLQSSSGIVLASRDVQRLMAIEADTFLTNALESEDIATRIYEFQGKRDLEVVRSFKSDLLPSGILRIGMSLDVYDQLYSSSLKQLGIISIVLFVLGIVGSYAATSIKKLQVVEGSLEQLQSITDEIVQSLEAGVVAIDRGGLLTLFNPRAERLFGKTSKAIIGKHYSTVFPDDLLSLQKIEQQPDQVRRGEIRFSPTPGDLRHLLISTVPIYGRQETYSGAVALVYDLTEIRKLEENARAAERLSELGSLAAGVAHEIRNPLNAISIATQRLASEFTPADDVDEYRSFLKTISEEIARLNTIIKDFLSLARAGHVAKVLVDLREYLDDILSLARLETEKQGITIEMDIDPGMTVNLDKLEMKKVFLNLIKNAEQAISDSGKISFRAAKLASGLTAIDISNSGASIPPDVSSKMWQPYFTTRKDGTGLGLAICRRIVADHGGTIELLEGSPTTFRIVV